MKQIAGNKPKKSQTKKSNGPRRKQPIQGKLCKKSRAQYNKGVLGYNRNKNQRYSFLSTEKRVSVLHDHIFHQKTIRELIKEHAVNYSTIRHILGLYYLMGRTQSCKFKNKSKIIKVCKRSAKNANNLHLDRQYLQATSYPIQISGVVTSGTQVQLLFKQTALLKNKSTDKVNVFDSLSLQYKAVEMLHKPFISKGPQRIDQYLQGT